MKTKKRKEEYVHTFDVTDQENVVGASEIGELNTRNI